MSNLNIQSNISLKNYTTFKIGGEAKFFVEVEINLKCSWMNK
jgi:UDP-N-acetylenolpyruvoylglucosamine reductase